MVRGAPRGAATLCGAGAMDLIRVPLKGAGGGGEDKVFDLS